MELNVEIPSVVIAYGSYICSSINTKYEYCLLNFKTFGVLFAIRDVRAKYKVTL